MSVATLLGTFDFLRHLPYQTISDIDSGDLDCALRLEPFAITRWQQGDTMNRPVQLKRCHHMFGISCLARTMFFPNFNGRCPLCFTTIVDTFQDMNGILDEVLSVAWFMGITQRETAIGKAALSKIGKACRK